MSNSYITSINSNYTLDIGFDTILIDATSSSIIVTVPTVLAVTDGTQLIFRRIDSNYNNTASLVGAGGEAFNTNSTLYINPNTNIKINAFNGNWYTVIGGAKGNEIDISFSQLVGTQTIRPYILIINNAFTSLGFFKYKGSNYYGTTPLKFEIVYSIDSSATATVNFNIQLQNITNANIISTIGSISQTGNNSMMYIASTTLFSNVPSLGAVIEIDGQINAGSANVRLHSVNLIVS